MLLSNFNLLTTAPGGVARLRELILTLAVQGKLVPQDQADEPASVLLQRIRAEKDRLIAEGKIKRDKPLPAITDEEKPFALPQGWSWARIGELGEVVGGGTPRSDEPKYWASKGIPWLTPADLYGRREVTISAGRRDISSEGLASSSARVLPAGTVLFSSRAPIGYVAIAANSLATNQGFKSCVPHLAGLSDYLYWHLKQMARKIDSEASGTTFKEISGKDFANVVLSVPPLPEQSRIVARVEELMRPCDALEAKGQLEATQHAQLVDTLLGSLTASATPEELAEHWQRVAEHFDLLLDRPEAINALEQTLLQLAVRGLLVPQDPQDEPASALLTRIRAEKDRLIAQGKIKRDKPLPAIADEEKPFELPVGWEWVRVGSIGITQTGGTPASNKPEYFDGDFPFIGPGQITPTGAILPPEKFISELGCSESAVAEPGDILMVCIGGSIGKCAATPFAVAFNQQINSIHPLSVSSEFILAAMTATDFVSAVVRTATGSATPIISKGKWDLLLLPLPPLPEQSRIVARVTALRQLCADLRQRLAERQSVQSRLAEALVAQAGG